MPAFQFNSTVTQVDLVNIALSYIHQPSINSTDEESLPAYQARLHWPLSIRCLLQLHDWSFAEARAYLQHSEADEGLENSPYKEWKYCYLPPSDLITFIDVLKGKSAEALTINTYPTIRKSDFIGNKIYANEDNLMCRYTSYIDNINVFPPLFMNALTYNLASRFSIPLLSSNTSQQSWYQQFSIEIERAIAADIKQDQRISYR
jgi:hypothetical protein